jgi:signal transduction histidine kinase/ligand-binding sensor domain-containing protein
MRVESRLRKTTVGVLVILTIVAHDALALDPLQPPSSYLRKDFTVEDGLPDNKVNAVVQTRNGLLWVATDRGLAMFDGERFAQVRLGSGISKETRVHSLLTTPNGDLWVGTDVGLAKIPRTVQDHFDRSLVRLYHAGAGLSDVINCLHLSRDGTLWAGTNQGLYQLDRGSLVSVIPGEVIHVIEEASNGHLLIITGQGLVEWDGSRITSDPGLAGQLRVRANEISQVLEDRHGVTWFSTAAGVARRVNGSVEMLRPYGASTAAAFRVYEDPQGTVWADTGTAFLRDDGTGLKPVAPELHARCMYSDPGGDLWVGTEGNGLVRFKDRTIRMYTTADGLPSNFTTTVLSSHDGTLWVGSYCDGLSRLDGQRFKTYNEKDGLSNTCVWSLAEDGNHDIWIGTWGGGLYRFRAGRFTQYSTPQGLAGVVALCIVAARDGSLWVATTNGLSHMQNGHLRSYTTADGLSSHWVTTVYQDRSGDIWAGTSAGIDRLRGDRFVPVQSGPQTSVVRYVMLREDSFGDLYALASENGISRIENNRVVSVNEIIRPTGMVESSEHDFWFGARNGIFRVAAAALKREASDRGSPLDYASFGRVDGMNSKVCGEGRPNIAITPDDKLWVGTVGGLAMLDLRSQPNRNRKPAVLMEEVDVGSTKRDPGAEAVLAPGAYHVELHFTAVDISSSENVRIQYRLDGVDPAWLDADSTRVAIYTYIPVGVHSFHIRASNGDGVWDRDGIVYKVTQQPYFYETGIFRVVVVMAGFLLVAGLYRLRLRQAAASLSARFDERLAERTRIARELHDTLLQGFQGVMLRLQVVDDLLPAGEAKEELERTLGCADQVIDEGRNTVHDLRESTIISNDLARALRSLAGELSREDSATFNLVLEGAARELHPIVRDEFYRIAREALRNAFNHAQAQRIEAELTYAEHLVRLRIRDDGVGIAPTIVEEGRSGHYGLPGMRERALKIGAKFNIWSGVGTGTEIDLSVPGSIAYGKSASRSRLRLFRKKSDAKL